MKIPNHISSKLCILILLIVSLNSFSETYYLVSYAYDAAGNRISRTYTIENKSAKMTPDSVSAEEAELLAKYSQSERFESFNEDIKYTIFPNPTNGNLALKISPFNEEMMSEKLSVYDLSGKIVFQSREIAGYNLINLSDQPAANYILELTCKGNKLRWKVTKN